MAVKKESDSRPSQNNKQSDDSDCSKSEDSDDAKSATEESCSDSKKEVRQSLGAKKLQKKVDDRKFTIETKLTVEKCGDRKRSKKGLPLAPAEPSPVKGKKKKSTNSDELNWMNC